MVTVQMDWEKPIVKGLEQPFTDYDLRWECILMLLYQGAEADA